MTHDSKDDLETFILILGTKIPVPPMYRHLLHYTRLNRYTHFGKKLIPSQTAFVISSPSYT